MKLIEALALAQSALSTDLAPLPTFLACGFTPLHLQTLLTGQLQKRFPQRRVQISTGIYQDLVGSIRKLAELKAEAAVVIMEWPDLDPRLGIRELGDWRPSVLSDIAQTVRGQLNRIAAALEHSCGRHVIALALPTLPLAPVGYTPRWQRSSLDSAIQEALASFASKAGSFPLVRILSSQEVDTRSPLSGRFDVRMEIEAGHPYSLFHADVMAELCASLIQPPRYKKGLITDLDGTLWKGILGDDGLKRIAWSPENHAQLHGLYQQLLRALADQGVLLAVATKNDPKLVEDALSRKDLVISKEHFFPIEAHWQSKSDSVSRILKTWNIASDSVVFVDDSPMELAEVQARHTDIEPLLFRGESPNEVYTLLGRLRDLFGKESIGAEDALRLSSIRSGAATVEAQAVASSPDAFLEQANAVLDLEFGTTSADPRALELVNKTNQWNLNGRRFSHAEWKEGLQKSGSALLMASYRDKYGPLGKIAVLRGARQSAGTLKVDVWVMSCRAFARRVEHACLSRLFERFDLDELIFDYVATDRNGPLREFLETILRRAPEPGQRLSRKEFQEWCPPLFHEVTENP